MNKSNFVYHGSQYLFDTVKPMKACGSGSEHDSEYAIYACDKFEWVIPFALPIRWYPDDPTGKRDFIADNGKTIIREGQLNPNGIGYVYKLPADTFIKVDKWQWISYVEVVPVEIIKINVRDYLHLVSYEGKAKEIVTINPHY